MSSGATLPVTHAATELRDVVQRSNVGVWRHRMRVIQRLEGVEIRGAAAREHREANGKWQQQHTSTNRKSYWHNPSVIYPEAPAADSIRAVASAAADGVAASLATFGNSAGASLRAASNTAAVLEAAGTGTGR